MQCSMAGVNPALPPNCIYLLIGDLEGKWEYVSDSELLARDCHLVVVIIHSDEVKDD